MQQLQQAPSVLIGEKHDNTDHHQLEAWLLKALREPNQSQRVLLEMLVPSQQTAVDAVQKRWTNWPRDESLEEALQWQKGWPWQAYQPVVEQALNNGYQLYAANIERSHISELYKAPQPLTGTASTDPAVQTQLQQYIRQSHCGLLPESQEVPMIGIQQHRDRSMAQAIADQPTPAILVAGAYHARKDVGVPLHLSDLQQPKPAVLILSEVNGKAVTAAQADYVWYTPAETDKDYCAEMREQNEQIKAQRAQ